jgi:hypothetical protein
MAALKVYFTLHIATCSRLLWPILTSSKSDANQFSTTHNAKKKKRSARFTTLLLSFNHYGCCTVILLLKTERLILLSSANVQEFFLLLCPSNIVVLKDCIVYSPFTTRHCELQSNSENMPVST